MQFVTNNPIAKIKFDTENITTNLIVIGDSEYEIEAGVALG